MSFSRSAARIGTYVIFATLAADAHAQNERPGPPTWSAGVMGIVRDTPYREADSDSLVVPSLGYEGERLYLRGLNLGWKFDPDAAIEIELIARARLDGFEAKDSPVFAGMQERERSLELGASAGRALGPGRIEFAAFADVLDRSGGQELDLMWRGDFGRGPFRIQPEAGLRWQSADLVDYYFGVRPSEATASRAAYRAGSAVLPRIAINALAPLGGRWSLFARVSVDDLPDEITDSPLVERGSERRAFVGLVYGFR
ncbi:MipA/OmpV family protein [Aquimonas sp.]|jgi:outer membrane protein|uniref:MipA/OmpV family protein n=1 Tax=Aquimonas sp. TaxID=1872588 RepID=UPI0037BF9D6A